ncbi:TPA: hypothetical protein ACG31N_002104 [Escherichia coli]
MSQFHDCVEITPLRASGEAYGLLVGLLALVWEKVRIRDLLGRENFA